MKNEKVLNSIAKTEEYEEPFEYDEEFYEKKLEKNIKEIEISLVLL